MDAIKSIELKMPDAIDKALYDALKYHSIESRVAYLKLISKEGERHYKSNNEWDVEINKHLIGLINAEIYSLEEELEEEREKYNPVGYRFNEETIEIELDMYDTIEEQIKYLEDKIKEFDVVTVNIVTNEYEHIKDKLTLLINNRKRLLEKDGMTEKEIMYSTLWNKIVDSYFNPHIISKCLDDVGIKNEDNFIEFMKKKFDRYSIEEWIKQYDTEDKLEQVERIKKDEKLSELDKHLKTVKVWDNKYLDSVVGKETLGRLRSFEKNITVQIKLKILTRIIQMT